MIQITLFEQPTLPRFDGAHYDEKLDRERLTGQILRVFEIISDGTPRTVSQICRESFVKFGTYDSETSVSAQLRNLRKQSHGGYNVQSERTSETGRTTYRLIK